MAGYLPNFPSGPLDTYRKRASFDWKQLSLFINGEKLLKLKNQLYNEMLKHPELLEQDNEVSTLDEHRHATIKKMFALQLVRDSFASELQSSYTDGVLIETADFYMLDPSAAMKRGLIFRMFTSAITSMGTERHEHFVKDALNGDIIGCFALTEVGHGSNTKAMKTTATYDPVSKQFIFHTPDFLAAKCWVGCLGQTATHAVVFAQLITPNGTKHGLHPFVVPVRNPKTLLPYCGVKICDLGEKIGLNGVDNGLVMFDHYCIPRENLLNKSGDVTEDGKYVTYYGDPIKRHASTLGNLSDGRIGITATNVCYLAKALTIGVRYAAVRRQFGGSSNEEEVPIIEYQSLQYRLLPHVAVLYAFRIFCTYILDERSKFFVIAADGNENAERLSSTGLEIHAISSACKPLSGWYVRDAIRECREICAGHGYLKASRLGDIRNDQDASCTYEGENHVLIQQTSSWLLRFWPLVLQGKPISTPLDTLHFLNSAPTILASKFSANTFEELTDPNCILSIYQWLCCYLLKSTFEKYKSLQKASTHSNQSKEFWAKNDSQVFFAKDLATAYMQHLVLKIMHNKILEANDLKVRNILLKLLALFGMCCLERHIPILYIGNYACNSKTVILIRESILKLCSNVKNDAVALIDAIAPPDFIVNSVLGYSDGQVYKHLEAAILRGSGASARPTWWKEIVNWKKDLLAKL